MIETTLLNYLRESLDVPVYMEEHVGVDSYVLIERTSGGEFNQLHSAQFAIQSYGASMYEAALLNSKLKTVMKGFSDVVNIGRVHLNSDYNFTDNAKKKYRYQAVYDIVYAEYTTD